MVTQSPPQGTSASAVMRPRTVPLVWNDSMFGSVATNTIGINTDTGRPATFLVQVAAGRDGYTVDGSAAELLLGEKPEIFPSLPVAKSWCDRQQAAIVAVASAVSPADVQRLQQITDLRTAQQLVDQVHGWARHEPGSFADLALSRIGNELEEVIEAVAGGR